jgi:hypothetical protein
MRQAAAALVAARALASRDETMSSTPALPDEEPALATAPRARRSLWWAWLLSLGKSTHASA